MLENSAPSGDAGRPPIGRAQHPAASINFVQALVTDVDLLEVRIVEASDVYVNYWVKHIQPEISGDVTRLDSNWDWLVLSRKNSAVNRIASLLRQTPKTYCIVAADREGKAFPIGMLHLVQRYPWILDATKSSSFIWYLSAAPKTLLDKRFGCRPRLMPAFIDAGLVVSVNSGHSGRLFLHADPNGKEILAASYLRCGLARATPDARISLVRKIMGRRNQRKNGTSGSYFYADEFIAEGILKLSDSLRSYCSGGRING
jgi:hypothetical protein